MARRSAQDIATRRPPGLTPPPAPPENLSLPEKRLWVEIVGSKPSGWFDAAALPVLEEFVRAAVSCDRLAAQLHDAGDDPVARERLLDVRDRESRRLGALGSKLRLLPSNRYRPDSAAARRPPLGVRPWMDGA